jgi:K+-transporting ATPase ATPase C chain
MTTFLHELKTSILVTVVLAALLCGVYPVVVWGGGQLLFRDKANGSLIIDADGTVRGSALLAQNFTSEKYFHPRPSAAGTGYDASSSSGTNLGPTSRKLAEAIEAAVAAYRAENHLTADVSVPADAVTASGSGLDPHISFANALLQAPRVARARRLPLERVHQLIATHLAGRDFHIFGEAGVNVLLLNRGLDAAVP